MRTRDLFGLDAAHVWDTELAFGHLRGLGKADTKRTAERRLQALGILPAELNAAALMDELGRPAKRLVLTWAIQQARSKRQLVLFAQLALLPTGQNCLHANDARGARYWLPLTAALDTATLWQALQRLQQHIGKEVAIFPCGALAGHLRAIPSTPSIRLTSQAYAPVLQWQTASSPPRHVVSPQLARLERQSIHILREAMAEARKPVMLYAADKDSSVMLHLARKAFYPALPPFPLLHVDTRWQFQEMYLFRDHMARIGGMNLLVHTNPEAIAQNINPFDHGAALHTRITQTEALRQALAHYQFDVVFGGARRDQAIARADARVFSLRDAAHHWAPQHQRPELWNLFNDHKNPGEGIRVFPLSHWTEIDLWHYIRQEDIPVAPLYFAKSRPVVVRADMIMTVDDDRCRLLPGEAIQLRKVRFRTLGCYPLTGAMASEAETLDDILLELVSAPSLERHGRKIEADSAVRRDKQQHESAW